ncbi:hypothetical protein C8250_000555 [Streptomyces sp. So13.3]|nr:hypothetical protein C8250_000555 [Streptomyces sp. So13.3]
MFHFFGQGYEEVAWLLVRRLERESWAAKTWRLPTAAAIVWARLRLGPDSFRVLLSRDCRGRRTGAWRWTGRCSTLPLRPRTRRPSEGWAAVAGRAAARFRRRGRRCWPSAERTRCCSRGRVAVRL